MMEGARYRLIANAEGTPGIKCLDCGSISWNRHDIEQLYCGHCKVFHEQRSMLPPPSDEERDPERDREANERAAIAGTRLKAHHQQMNMLTNRAMKEPNRQQKIIWLWRLTQPLKTVMKDVAACREGCAHCCYTPVLISHVEAEVISKLTGHPMVSPSEYTIEPNMSYLGVPCPFLKDDRCSIYSSRPFACRVHYNMDRDNAQCVLGSAPKIVRYFDRRSFDMVYVTALSTDDMRYADVRDFFPR